MKKQDVRNKLDAADAWGAGKDVMRWWTSRQKKTEDMQEISLFGLRLHESDT